MYKSLLACAFVAGLSSCAQPQPVARMPTAAEVAAGATIPCPPGYAEHCARTEYRNQSASLRVESAKKNLALANEFYAKHPDAQHAADVAEAQARLNTAVARSD